MFFSIRKVNQNIDPLFRKPKKDFEPSGKTEITFEGVELIRNDEIFRDQGQGSTDIFYCLLHRGMSDLPVYFEPS